MQFSSALSLTILLSLAGVRTEGRNLGDSSAGILLTALCIKDGRLRQACLEGISSVSIQKFLDKLIGQMKDERSFGTLLTELEGRQDESDDSAEMLPQKRGRNRGQSGFYSNW